MCDLEGEKILELMEMRKPYCISLEEHLLAVSTPLGFKIFKFFEDGSYTEHQGVESRHIQLAAFSPSGKMLGLIDDEGVQKVELFVRIKNNGNIFF